MDRLRDIEVFVAIAQERSLTKAGQRLGLSPPSVTRALARLEDRLGKALFLRSTRSLTLTAAGEAYLPLARNVLETVQNADAALADAETLRGTLTLTAPRQLGRIVIAPILARFLDSHPGVAGKLILADRVAHLLDEGIDLGVRIGALADTSDIARRVGVVHQRLVASPDYLSAFGTPVTPAALAEHRLIPFTGRLRNGRLVLDGASQPYEPARITVDCAATALDLAEAGEGIAPVWSYQCARAVADGRLATVLDRAMPEPSPCHLIWPDRRYENVVVRTFVDFAAPEIRSTLEAAAKAVGAQAP